MSQTLVIAEKPSVATDIARALGGFKKEGDFWIGEEYIVGSAVGHLLELSVPEEFDVKRGRWSFNNLPVVPPYFEVKPIKKTESKFNALSKMIRSRKVTAIINACDAGREGELIFRFIMQAVGTKKPISRLWLQSMTKDSIRAAFESLRTDEEMRSLEEAARSRAEADWLVGINGTRAMTAFNSKEGGFFLTTVGRVQTPTLAIVVTREKEIQNFVSRPYWEVKATFQAKAGHYESVWFNPEFKKIKDDAEARADRFFSEKEARAVVEACRGKPGVVTETKKRTRQLPPALFDLTSLQREANGRFGFSAKTTLSIAQSLYEKHKVLTYPRTDARALPEDYIPTVKETLANLQELDAYSSFVGQILEKNWVKSDKRIFDNSKISDHFAIVPTGQMPKTLSEAEAKIFDLVTRRFMAVFFPAAEFDVTTRITKVQEHSFRTEGKVQIVRGWTEVTGRASKAGADLCEVQDHESVLTKDIEKEALATKPPARFNEATLLSAMEGAGKTVEQDELRDAMAGKGLGTPATRASIIETLIEQKYIRRDARDLIPTPKAFQLIALLRGLTINALTDPALTGEWEHKLSLIEKGNMTRADFMKEISTMTEHIVSAAKLYDGDMVPIENPVHLQHCCPQCGSEVVENYRRFACANKDCGFSLPKVLCGRLFSVEELETLLAEHQVGPLQGFISKKGWPFEAMIDLVREEGLWQIKFAFEDMAEEKAAEIEDAKNQPEIGVCPVCGGRVLATATAYVCEKALVDSKKCAFRMGRTILQREISEAEAKSLIETGRTQLLDGFISKRTNRPFKSFLVIDKKGRVGFEFQKKEGSDTVAEKVTKKTTRKSKKVE